MNTCYHPRRCVNLMREFLTDANTCTYQGVKKTVIVRKDDKEGFCTDISAVPSDEIHIYYTYLDTSEDEMFRNFIDSTFPEVSDIADITISLLHELGHNVHWKKTFSYDRTAKMREMKTLHGQELANAYFNLPDELAATKWAINWLKKPENRQRAKRFEKEFFAAFRGA